MSKIAQAFARGKAFIPFITCGDPDLETTAAAVRAAVENGADLIELGIPFSDPTAEGPVIQEANVRALSAGTTTIAYTICSVTSRDGSPQVTKGMKALPFAKAVLILLIDKPLLTYS